MKRIVAVVALLLPAACLEQPASPPDSGIRGVVLLGPQCPVEREGTPCPAKPFVGSVEVTRPGFSVEVETDEEGRFEMGLDPGTYVVQAVVEGDGPPTAVPLDVTVKAGELTEVTLEVDTGIR